MHHGTTVVHWDSTTATNRSARIYMRLEKNCSTLTWGKATWSALKSSHCGLPDYSLKTDIEEYLSNSLVNRTSVDCKSSICELNRRRVQKSWVVVKISNTGFNPLWFLFKKKKKHSCPSRISTKWKETVTVQT